MTKKLCLFSTFLAFFLLTACDQYPIFYTIATEPEPRDPLIKGSPSKIVTASESDGKTYFYVANGGLWRTLLSEGSAGTWQKVSRPGAVRDIAIAGDYLYALTLDGSTLNLFKKNVTLPEAEWETFSVSGNPQRVFAGGEALYVGVGIGSAGTVWRSTTAGAVQVSGITGELRGAASSGGKDYLATLNNGLWQVTDNAAEPAAEPAATQIENTSSYEITGVISVDDVIIAVDANGSLYNSGSGSWSSRTDYEFTGALAFWTDGTDRLLLAGVHAVSSSYTYGYFEASLGSGAAAVTASSFVTPVLSIGGQESEYTSSVGKHPINHLAVTPGLPPEGELPVIFASTQKDGLWAYRGEWNAEK